MKTIFSKLIIVMIFIIYTSNAQWKHLYNGLSDPIKSIYWIGLNSQNDSNIFCTLESYSLFESTDYGDTWKEINLPNVVENYGPIIASGSTIFIGSTGHGLYKSTDDGKNWQNIDLFSIRKPSNTKLTVHKINEFKIAGNNIYLSTDEGLFVSNDEFKSWADLTADLQSEVYSTIIQDSSIYIEKSGNSGLMSSYDNGVSWNKFTSGFGKDAFYTTMASSDSLLLCSLDKILYISTDKGNNWNQIYVAQQQVSQIICCNNNIFIVDNRAAILKSSDKGKTWSKLPSGYNENWVTNFAINKKYLYAGTGIVGIPGGLYRIPFKDCDIDFSNDVDEFPKENSFSISPNPSSENISISYTEYLNPSISIFNSLGIEIKRITENELLGKSTINITTDEFSSGIYYCTLSSGINKITKSFVVVH